MILNITDDSQAKLWISHATDRNEGLAEGFLAHMSLYSF